MQRVSAELELMQDEEATAAAVLAAADGDSSQALD
jgi:hypothetical protein